MPNSDSLLLQVKIQDFIPSIMNGGNTKYAFWYLHLKLKLKCLSSQAQDIHSCNFSSAFFYFLRNKCKKLDLSGWQKIYVFLVEILSNSFTLSNQPYEIQQISRPKFLILTSLLVSSLAR